MDGGYEEFRRRNDELNRRMEERREDERRHQERLRSDQQNMQRLAEATRNRFSSTNRRTPLPTFRQFKSILVISVVGASMFGLGTLVQRFGGLSKFPNIFSADLPPPLDKSATKSRASPSVIDRTESALLDQLSCREPPAAGLALTAMIRNGIVKATDDGGDGSLVYAPAKPIELLGFPVVHLTGWQPDENGGAMPPFARGPGTAPPNFISVAVRASPDAVKRAIREKGIREQRSVPDPNGTPLQLQGQTFPAQISIPGIVISSGDLDLVETPADGLTTLSCTANEYDFQPARRVVGEEGQ